MNKPRKKRIIYTGDAAAEHRRQRAREGYHRRKNRKENKYADYNIDDDRAIGYSM